MDPFTIALIGGGLGLFGQALGGAGQARAAAQARADAARREQNINSWTQPFLNPTQSYGAQQLESLLRGMPAAPTFNAPTVGYNAPTVSLMDTSPFMRGTNLPQWIQTEISNAGTLTPTNATATTATGTMNDLGLVNRFLDFGRLTNPQANTATFNSSQDALMQMIRGNGGYNSITAQLDPTAGMNLNELVSGNSRFDTSDLFASLAPLEDRARDSALQDLNAQAGSLGRRFGTATQARSADMLTQLTEQANARKQQLAFQAFEAAQGRRIQAADLINTRDNMVNQVAMADQNASINATGNRIQGAVGATNAAVDMAGVEQAGASSYNNVIAQLLGQAMGNTTQLATGNQKTAADISMFNAGAANTAALANADAANTMAAQNAANFLTAQGQRSQQGIAQNSFGIDVARLQGDDLQRLAQILQFNTGQSNTMAMNNASNALQASTTNANNSIQTQALQAQVQQALLQMMMGGYSNLMSNSNTQAQQALQALGLRAGQPLPPTSAGMGMQAFGAGLGDMGSILGYLSMMQGRGVAGQLPLPAGQAYSRPMWS